MVDGIVCFVEADIYDETCKGTSNETKEIAGGGYYGCYGSVSCIQALLTVLLACGNGIDAGGLRLARRRSCGSRLVFVLRCFRHLLEADLEALQRVTQNV